jgi:phage gp29-like protein
MVTGVQTCALPISASLYWYHYAKQIALREGLQGLERWAQGWVIFKGDRGAPADEDNPNSTFITNAIQELETHSGRHVLGIDSADSIEVEQGPSTGWEMVKWWITYLDDSIVECLTGSSIALGGGDGKGTLARGKVEQDTNDLVTQGDQEDLAETLTSDLVLPMIDWNRPTLAAAGLDSAQPPTWEFVEDVVADPATASTVIDTAARIGMELDAEDTYKKLNLKRPQSPEDVLRLTPATMPGMSGMSGADPMGGGSRLASLLEPKAPEQN